MAESANDPLSVDFYFDPICPWAWAASRWMLHVTEVRPVVVTWRLFSLSAVFAERDKPDQFAEALELGWGTSRAIIAAQEFGGNDSVLNLYNVLGTRMHVEKQPPTVEMVQRSVADAGVDERAGAAVTDPQWDEAIWAEHAVAVEAVGEEIGTPILSIGGRGYFGPVLTQIPRGEDAGRLFDALRTCMAVPGFSEFKRGRDVPFPDLG